MAFVGIDVSSGSLSVYVEDGRRSREGEFENTSKGHRALLKWVLKQKKNLRVVAEPTSVYGLDLALLLHRHPRVSLMMANPRSVKAFHSASHRAKTDKVDARVLADYGRAMPWIEWQPPSMEALELRQLVRRRQQLVELRTMERNRLHAATSTSTTAVVVRQSIEAHLEALDASIEALERGAVQYASEAPTLSGAFRLLQTIPGIAEISAIRILSELAVLPSDMDTRQLTAHAGLDPRPRQSGNVDGRRHISKRGNKHLRHALYMPALTAIRVCAPAQRWYEQLTSRQRKHKQAVVAVMRKLLVTSWGMLKSNSAFDETRFRPGRQDKKRAA
jgi:transposase